MKLVDLSKIDLSTLDLMYCNERPIETQALIKLLNTVKIDSLLDVGAHYSYNYYVEDVRKILKNKIYDGIDILEDKKTASLLDNYYVGNVCSTKLNKYDFVSCISSIEHSGLTTYKEQDHIKEQQNVFRKITEISSMHIFLTFPFGEEGLYPGEYANITDKQLRVFDNIARSIGFKKRHFEFYYSEFPQGRMPYMRLPRAKASLKSLVKERGIQCICLAWWNKGK